ncbi:putative quinol monooxygenase [Mucilaginibacter sp. McL0603]|uniref:putative quinol monooxygenase n=1 Tax=Mucilaginibacter sp. McL0603 TaxID=3415670 RepID=UPI003CF9D615
MKANKILRLIAKVRIGLADRPRFIQMTGELKAIVAEEGPTQVLSYDCYFKDLHTGECLITETYADEAALLSHLKLIAPVSAKYQVPMEIIRFELCGELAETTLALFRDTYGDRFEHYDFRI